MTQERPEIPDQSLQRLPDEIYLHEWQRCTSDGVRRPGGGPKATAEQFLAVRSGSLVNRSSFVAEWRAPFRAPDRLLPGAENGAKSLPAIGCSVSGSTRPAGPEGPAAAVRCVL